jgi:hypothetical protein
MGFSRGILAGVLTVSAMLAACASRGYYAYSVPPPPAPYAVGAVGYAPGPGYVWMDGFWDLRGTRWVWVSGRWGRPPRPHAVWMRSRWEPYGRGGWRFHAGYWRY